MKMFKKALIAALVVAAMPVFAEDAKPVDVTLTGEPVDITCYLGGKSGEGHAACATACANKGNPIGLVVDEGDNKVMYLVLGSGGKAAKDLLAAHMGKQVDVTGKATKKEGMSVVMAAAVAEASAEEEEWFPEEVVGGASVIEE